MPMMPADAPTTFVPKALQRFIRDKDGKLKKSAWECALLTQLKDEIRAGNLSVNYSKRFGRFNNFPLCQDSCRLFLLKCV